MSEQDAKQALRDADRARRAVWHERAAADLGARPVEDRDSYPEPTMTELTAGVRDPDWPEALRLAATIWGGNTNAVAGYPDQFLKTARWFQEQLRYGPDGDEGK